MKITVIFGQFLREMTHAGIRLIVCQSFFSSETWQASAVDDAC